MADAVYAGSVTMGGKTTGLIESRSTKEGTYVNVGDEWHGFHVVSVSESEITLSVNGSIRRLFKSDTINIVPLSASATGTTPGAQIVGSGTVTMEFQGSVTQQLETMKIPENAPISQAIMDRFQAIDTEVQSANEVLNEGNL